MKSNRRAFTLIELLTVIAIIGILAAILIPTIGKVRLQGKSAQSSGNLREIGRALIMLAELNKGKFPSGEFDPGTPTGSIPYNFWKAERGVPSILYSQKATGQKAQYGAWYGQHKPVIDGTVLSSPLRESDTSDVLCAISYGYNWEITRTGKNLNLTALHPISQTMLVGDVFKTNQMKAGTLHARNGATAEYARNGRALVAYIDGHVKSLTQAEVDEINANTTPNAKRAWGL
ncbi:MAG: hypothetical protein RLZZ50_89 [Verrucomicrobiota bacterium]|jgi:prepilin-type N-terminal cleavage/methylation domain-containing protein